MASHYQVVFLVADKNPLTVSHGFLLGWCLTLGVPECLRFDLGGEFESSFSELTEQIGCRFLPTAFDQLFAFLVLRVSLILRIKNMSHRV